MLKIVPFVFIVLFSVCNLPSLTYAQVIHEIRAGDTLTKIAGQYNTTPESVAQLNGLKGDARLITGQAIFLSGSSYIVQPGDSLAAIAHRHAISETLLKSYNRIRSALIIPGQKVDIPPSPKMDIWTGAYFVPKDKTTNAWMLNYYTQTLSGAFVFDYHPNEKGEIVAGTENEAHTIAWQKNVIPYAALTNRTSKGYDPDLTHRILGNDVLRAACIENIYSLLDSHDYKGVMIDFEMVHPGDRGNLSRFVRQLAMRLHLAHMEVLIALPPMTGAKMPSDYGGYDYRTIGRYADKLFVMAYNWKASGNSLGAIAPMQQIRSAVNYAASVVPKSKLMLGIPQYAYDWTITGKHRTGVAYSSQHANHTYAGHASQIHYDEMAALPWFQYADSSGALHEVWFEDPRSLLAKLRLVKEYGLGGIGCWPLGTSIPQTEELLLEEFHIQ